MNDVTTGRVVPPDERSVLAERLRTARTYMGIKQEKVASFLDIGRTAVSEMESGKRQVSAVELKRLASLYQKPIGWFTGEADLELSEDVQHLARTASSLADEDRAQLKQFAEFLKGKSLARRDDA